MIRKTAVWVSIEENKDTTMKITEEEKIKIICERIISENSNTVSPQKLAKFLYEELVKIQPNWGNQ